MSEQKSKRGKRIVLGTLTCLIALFASYGSAIMYFRPDESKMTAWDTDLKSALAVALQVNGLVVVKAGSRW